MGTEGYVQLPPDSSGKKIRMLQVAPDGVTVEYEEAVVLADDDGNLVIRGGLGAKTLPVTVQDLAQGLQTIAEGIAHLLTVLTETSGTRLETKGGEWVDRTLRAA